MPTVDLNCDMGEGMDNDALLMPLISSANIACGAHAGDEYIMHDTIMLALQYGVAIGAHPGFADKAHFGRLELDLSPNEIYELVYKQVSALRQMCTAVGSQLHHVKPHGALYNMAARSPAISKAITEAIVNIDPTLIFYGLSGSHMIAQANLAGLATASEVFADRTYQPNGSLTPRSHHQALIEDEQQSLRQVLQMVNNGTVTTVDNKTIRIEAQTICLHSDGEHPVEFATLIRNTLRQHSIGIKTI